MNKVGLQIPCADHARPCVSKFLCIKTLAAPTVTQTVIATLRVHTHRSACTEPSTSASLGIARRAAPIPEPHTTDGPTTGAEHRRPNCPRLHSKSRIVDLRKASRPHHLAPSRTVCKRRGIRGEFEAPGVRTVRMRRSDSMRQRSWDGGGTNRHTCGSV